MRTIVIYHGGGCADGFCSAWLFSKKFGGGGHRSAAGFQVKI